jgi:hypothetical protein
MKLRDQLRTDKGSFYNWPPIWTNTREDPSDKPQGEIGYLQDVFISEDNDNIVFIAIEYHGRRYMGAMGFDSEKLCFQIATVLQSNIGLSIEEIGDLDLA